VFIHCPIYFNLAYPTKREGLVSLIIGPPIGGLQQGAQVIDFPGVIEIVGDHNADDIAGGEPIAPIRQSLTFELGVIRKSADGGKPAAMPLR